MAVATKKELMEQHKQGLIKPVASYGLSNTGGLAIIEADDEKVFGYSSYGQDEIKHTDYFYVKVNYTSQGRGFFKVGQLTIYLDECMRINQGGY